jgi:hypothetical protein
LLTLDRLYQSRGTSQDRIEHPSLLLASNSDSDAGAWFAFPTQSRKQFQEALQTDCTRGDLSLRSLACCGA